MKPVQSIRFRAGQYRRARQLKRAGHEAQELDRLYRLGRNEAAWTDLFGAPFYVADPPSFVAQYEEIFQRGAYAFETDSPVPLVIDAGANVGVATAFFKQRHPNARVIAFEADPVLADIVASNVQSLGLRDVTVVPAALAPTDGTVTFWQQGGDAGRVGGAPPRGGHPIDVPTVRLATYLHEMVDLLKVDIEGAEFDVLLDAEAGLVNVARIAMECHSAADQPQRLGELLSMFTAQGFRYFIQHEAEHHRPLVEDHTHNGFDNQLLVWAEKTG